MRHNDEDLELLRDTDEFKRIQELVRRRMTMNDKEFYTRLRKFLDDNMPAFTKWNTDVGELNELSMELNRRIGLCEVEIPDFMKKAVYGRQHTKSKLR